MRVLALTALLLPTLALAEPSPDGTLEVLGVGEASAAPDCVELSFEVSAWAADHDRALKAFNASWQRVHQRLAKLPFIEGGLRTQAITLGENERVESGMFGESRRRGTQVRRAMTVKLQDPAKLDELVAALAAAKVSEITSLRFTSTRMEELQTRARVQAMSVAYKNAQAMAGVIGQDVGSARSVVEQPLRTVAEQSYARISTSAKGAQLPVPGEVTASVQVRVVFALPPKAAGES